MTFSTPRRGLDSRGPARLLFVLMFLASTLVSVSVSAQNNAPKMFVLPTQSVRDSVTSIVPERIGELLREQVERDNRVDLLPGYGDIQEQLGGSTTSMAKAESLYTSGIGLLTAGKDKEASENFQRAVELMETNLAEVTDYDILSDAIANLAVAYFNSGFDLDARKRMQQFAHLKPNQKLDPERFPKELREIYAEEAEKVKSAKPGKLTIKAPKGALVYIDGVEKGEAPATVDDVGFGHHYLVVRTADGKAYAEQIRVRGRGKKQAFEADLTQSATAAAGGGVPAYYTDLLDRVKSGEFSDEGLAPYLEELTKQTNAALVGWVVMYKKPAGGGYVAAPFAYRAKDGRVVQGEDVTFNIELSNLLVGVSDLSKRVVDLAVDMPDDKVVQTVTLGGPPPEVATTTSTSTSSSTTGTASTGNTSGDVVASDTNPGRSGSTWKYVAIAAGGVLAVGLVAGGIYLLTSGEGPAAPGFNAEVTW